VRPPEHHQPGYLYYTEPQFPGEPENYDQYLTAGRCLQHLDQAVSVRWARGTAPLTTQQVLAFCQAWSVIEQVAQTGSAFSVAHVYAVNQRRLISYEYGAVDHQAVRRAERVHPLLREATAVALLPPDEREMWDTWVTGNFECYDCGGPFDIGLDLSETEGQALQSELIYWCPRCDGEPWQHPWPQPPDDDDEYPF
jgi:hypothetical protein